MFEVTHELFASILAEWGYRELRGKSNYRLYQNTAWQYPWVFDDKTNDEQFIHLNVDQKGNKPFTIHFAIKVKNENTSYFSETFDEEFLPPNVHIDPNKTEYWKKLIKKIEPKQYEKGTIIDLDELEQFKQALKERLLLIQNSVNLKHQHEFSSEITQWPKELPLISERPLVYGAIPCEKNEVYSLLKIIKKHKSVILEGVPGVGKTHFYEQLSKHKEDDSETPYFQHKTFLTFHPSTDYSDFIGGLRPALIDEKLIFKPKAGHLLQILDEARNGPVLLWIDEINRANIPKVFGDLISLLGNKNPPKLEIPNVGLAAPLDVSQLAKNGVSIIDNLHIIGTMNTSDRSVTPLDLAMRRRFKFFRIEPFGDLEARSAFKDTPKMNEHINCYLGLNKFLETKLGLDYLIGHSYLFEIRNAIEGDTNIVWKNAILPNIIDSLVLAQKEELCNNINEILKNHNIELSLIEKGHGFNKMLLVEQDGINSQEEIIALLKQKNNVVLEGVPGTGKTHILQNIADNWMSQTKSNLEIQSITFHPSSSYEDFVGGLFPFQSKKHHDLIFKYKKGVLFKIAEEAMKTPDKDYLLFIDEINRANIPKVMGELLTVMESSKRSIPRKGKTLDSSENPWNISVGEERLSLPTNLYILATLNTSDRSVISMDSALRRRFGYYRMETLIHSKRKRQLPSDINEDILNSLIMINEELKYIGPDAVLGHSYLFGSDQEESSDISALFRLTILPQIADILNSTTPSNLEDVIRKINAQLPQNSEYQLSAPNHDAIIFVQKKASNV